MDRAIAKLIGAYITKRYYQELFDKFHAAYPKYAMTHLLRALLGMWFDGKIKLTVKDLNQYKHDGRERNVFRPRGWKFPAGVQLEGYKAAEAELPELANPYPADTAEREAWLIGWKAYFNR